MKQRKEEEGAVLEPLYAAALRHDVLSKDAELELCTKLVKVRAKHGVKHPKTLRLRNQLITSNIRMIAKLAHRYKRLPFEDLMSEGVKGLIIAAERFEPQRGYRFGTFATYWVRHALQRASEDLGSIVRVPVHTQTKLFSHRIESDGVKLVGKPSSFDAKVAGPDSGNLYELMDTGETPVVDMLGELKLNADLMRVVRATLDPRELEVIVGRFAEDKTLSEVGVKLESRHQGGRPSRGGVSRERVRQLQDSALLKLRLALNRNGMSKGACL